MTYAGFLGRARVVLLETKVMILADFEAIATELSNFLELSPTLNLTEGAVAQIRRPRSVCHALEALAPKWDNTTHLHQLHRLS